jgi:hypothetical protein
MLVLGRLFIPGRVENLNVGVEDEVWAKGAHTIWEIVEGWVLGIVAIVAGACFIVDRFWCAWQFKSTVSYYWGRLPFTSDVANSVIFPQPCIKQNVCPSRGVESPNV